MNVIGKNANCFTEPLKGPPSFLRQMQ